MISQTSLRLTKLVSGIAVVISLLGSSAPGQIFRRVQSLVVVDSNNTFVGGVVGVNGGADVVRVAFQLGQHGMLLFDVTPSMLGGVELLRFPSEDCTGVGFANVFQPEWRLFVPTAVRSPDSTLFVFDTSSEPVAVQTNSTLFQDGDGTETCGSQISEFEGYPAIPTGIDLDQFFTPPFRLVQPRPQGQGDGFEQ